MGSEYLSLYHCEALRICKQVHTKKGRQWTSETIYYFDTEYHEDEPTYSIKEILAEAKYRKCLRELDKIEAENL